MYALRLNVLVVSSLCLVLSSNLVYLVIFRFIYTECRRCITFLWWRRKNQKPKASLLVSSITGALNFQATVLAFHCLIGHVLNGGYGTGIFTPFMFGCSHLPAKNGY